MRSILWLLSKDLRILMRSPLTTTVLIVYPVAIALLIGFAFSRGSDKPTVAVFHLDFQQARLIVVQLLQIGQ